MDLPCTYNALILWLQMRGNKSMSNLNLAPGGDISSKMGELTFCIYCFYKEGFMWNSSFELCVHRVCMHLFSTSPCLGDFLTLPMLIYLRQLKVPGFVMGCNGDAFIASSDVTAMLANTSAQRPCRFASDHREWGTWHEGMRGDLWGEFWHLNI